MVEKKRSKKKQKEEKKVKKEEDTPSANAVVQSSKKKKKKTSSGKSDFKKPEGWDSMSKAKKRRLRKMHTIQKMESAAVDNSDDAKVTPSGAIDGPTSAATATWTKPKGWDSMSKSKKRRLRKIEVEKKKQVVAQNGSSRGDSDGVSKGATEIDYYHHDGADNTMWGGRVKKARKSRKKNRPTDSLVKDHPMYRKYWRLSLHPGVKEADVKAKMAEDGLDTSLYGQWAKTIKLRGHGTEGKSRAKLRRERKKRALERYRKEANAQDLAHWDQVGVTQVHSFEAARKKKRLRVEDEKQGGGEKKATEQVDDEILATDIIVDKSEHNTSTATKKKKKMMKKKSPLVTVNKLKTVFVSGLPHHVGVKKVRQYFKSCGAVAYVSMPRFEDTNKSRGIAQISFTRQASAKRAIELSGEYWGQRYLEITPYDDEQWKPSTEKIAGSRTIFVGNLAYDVEEDLIREVFATCGTIESTRWATDKETGEFRCFGHVTFEETSAVDKAVKISGALLKGRPLRIDYAEDKKKGDFDE